MTAIGDGDYGFRVIGDDGYTQIDESYRNYALVARGSGQTDTNYKNASFATLSVGGLANPVLAIIPTGSTAVTVTSSTQNGSGTFSWVIYGAGAAGATFDYFVFDRVPQAVIASDYGLVVRNGASQTTFDSDYRYMRVVGFTAMGYSFSPVSGRRYAVVFCGGVVQIIRTGGTGNTQIAQTTGLFVTNSGATQQYTIDVYTGQFPPTTIAYTYSLLYVDVTNF